MPAQARTRSAWQNHRAKNPPGLRHTGTASAAGAVAADILPGSKKKVLPGSGWSSCFLVLNKPQTFHALHMNDMLAGSSKSCCYHGWHEPHERVVRLVNQARMHSSPAHEHEHEQQTLHTNMSSDF